MAGAMNGLSPFGAIAKLIVIAPISFSLSYLPLAPAAAQSVSYCEQYARDYARRNSQGQALRSTAEGAAGGAIFGAIAGDAGAGAGIGALIGGISGTSRESSDYNYLYRIAYDDCIRGRVRY